MHPATTPTAGAPAGRDHRTLLSRRRFVRGLAAVALVAPLALGAAGCGDDDAAGDGGPVKLSIFWWGGDARAKLTEDDAALSSREQALTEGKQALADERAALDAADADLKAREQALKDKQADYDAKLSDYASLQQAVDEALNARGRIATAMKAAFAVAGVSVAVDGDGAASVPVVGLFTGNSTALSKDGKALLDRLIPAWYGALKGENAAALSVEVSAASDDSEALGIAARRSLAILEYARQIPSLGADARAALLTTGLSGARAASDGDARAVFRFYLNNDALKTARAG
jgi:hypothetical protein